MLAPRNEVMTSQELERYLRAGSTSTSGATVTYDSAVTVSAVFACARIIAEDLGKLPWPVYRRLPNDGKERATSSPFWTLIHDRPFGSPTTFSLSSQQFREFLTFCAVLRGDGFAFKNTINGQVRELIPIHPSRVTVEQLEDFEVIYHVQLKNGERRTHTRREIFHLMGPTMNGYSGASIVNLARESIGLALTSEQHTSRTLGTGARHRGIIERPLDAPEWSNDGRKRFREEYEETYSGSANSYRTLILEDGMTWKSVGMSSEDAELLSTRQFSVTEIARWFRIPPHKIAELSRATFTNIEHQAIEYVTDTLLPWGVRWDTAVNQQVIGPGQFYAELLFEGLLRGDTKTRYEAYQIAVQNGLATPDELRRMENLAPLGEEATVLLPLNVSTRTDRDVAQMRVRADAAGILVRAGYDPERVAEVVGLPPIPHSGQLPVTVQS